MSESFLLLSIAVILFRTFAAEGYLISTGSMAPSLLGYHRRVICPDCRFPFAHGAAFESGFSPGDVAHADLHADSHPLNARCPNCGLSDIDPRTVPRNEGDQLLVHKQAYQFRPPRRWEVVVFRNPSDPRQAYVKRVVGLPGERLEIIDGDVYADGELCRKPYPVQAALRVPVSHFAHVPRDEDPDWRPRWQVLSPASSWKLQPARLVFRGRSEGFGKTDWIAYRHWIRNGGTHETVVDLPHWPERVDPPNPRYSNLRFESGKLICEGALTDLERRRWLAQSDDALFQRAVEDLFERSHCAPVTDEDGYNAGDPETFPLRDFMLSLEVSGVAGTGRIEMQLTNGARTFCAVFDFSDDRVDLLMDEDPVPVRRVRLNREIFHKPVRIDFSLFDRQALVAVNRQPIFPPLPFEGLRDDATRAEGRRPARIGAAGIDCTVRDLRLFRDVYYANPASGPARYRIGADEFFVLGDNSPVSVDSRVWENPAVSRDALIGKPFVVHLPSKQAQIEWGGQIRAVRIPDFERIRPVR